MSNFTKKSQCPGKRDLHPDGTATDRPWTTPDRRHAGANGSLGAPQAARPDAIVRLEDLALRFGSKQRARGWTDPGHPKAQGFQVRRKSKTLRMSRAVDQAVKTA